MARLQMFIPSDYEYLTRRVMKIYQLSVNGRVDGLNSTDQRQSYLNSEICGISWVMNMRIVFFTLRPLVDCAVNGPATANEEPNLGIAHSLIAKLEL